MISRVEAQKESEKHAGEAWFLGIFVLFFWSFFAFFFINDSPQYIFLAVLLPIFVWGFFGVGAVVYVVYAEARNNGNASRERKILRAWILFSVTFYLGLLTASAFVGSWAMKNTVDVVVLTFIFLSSVLPPAYLRIKLASRMKNVATSIS